jgi:hypothetical protein
VSFSACRTSVCNSWCVASGTRPLYPVTILRLRPRRHENGAGRGRRPGGGVSSPGKSLRPRNAPCPCGSGRKYKKCCLDREPALRRSAEALEEVLALPTLFPLISPIDAEFELWACEHAGEELDRELIEEGISLLPTGELERIADAHARDHPEAWASLVADDGDEDEARTTVIVGAVTAALAEQRELCPHCLVLVEDGRDRDAAEVLARLVEPCDLWSIEEAVLAEDEVDVARLAKSRWSDDHERRLTLLVERVGARLPQDARVGAAAVAEFRENARVRRRLAGLLLEDAVSALRLFELAA